jgi:hypothetical protein
LQDLRQVVVGLRESIVPPTVPTNLQVTAQAFANLVQWTRSINADFYEVLWSSTPNIGAAIIVNVGNSAQWTDPVGQSAITRFYWVRAGKNTGARSEEVGFKSATTLASGTGVTPPKPPPPSQNQALNQRTGRIEPY